MSRESYPENQGEFNPDEHTVLDLLGRKVEIILDLLTPGVEPDPFAFAEIACMPNSYLAERMHLLGDKPDGLNLVTRLLVKPGQEIKHTSLYGLATSDRANFRRVAQLVQRASVAMAMFPTQQDIDPDILDPKHVEVASILMTGIAELVQMHTEREGVICDIGASLLLDYSLINDSWLKPATEDMLSRYTSGNYYREMLPTETLLIYPFNDTTEIQDLQFKQEDIDELINAEIKKQRRHELSWPIVRQAVHSAIAASAWFAVCLSSNQLQFLAENSHVDNAELKMFVASMNIAVGAVVFVEANRAFVFSSMQIAEIIKTYQDRLQGK
jgi:hypothetical protein